MAPQWAALAEHCLIGVQQAALVHFHAQLLILQQAVRFYVAPGQAQ